VVSSTVPATSVALITDGTASTPIATPVQPAIQAVSGLIDPLIGGSLDTPEGRVHFSLPLAATLDQVMVTVAPGAPVSSDQGLLASTTAQPMLLFQTGTTRIDVTALDTASAPVVGLAQQMTLTVEPDMADLLTVGGDAARVKLARLDEATGAWIPLATRSLDGHLLSTDSGTLGHFAVLLQTGTPTVCLADGTSLWSSAAMTADLFGQTSGAVTFRVLDQIEQRYMVQDSQGNLAWIDVAAASACQTPGTAEQPVLDQVTSVPQEDATTGVPQSDVETAEITTASEETATVTIDDSAIAPADVPAAN
jgi:hypothetical protein